MIRLSIAALLATAVITGLARFGLADSQAPTSDSYPVVAQLALRDRIVTITSAPTGYLYSIADESGAILNAGLTEEQMAEQYPELLDRLRPAVADDDSQLMILAPVVK